MLSKRSRYLFVVAVAGLLWLPVGSWAQNPQVQGQATATAPAEPPAALTQEPSGQVVVTYQNGDLTIKARNAPLIDVLRAVCSQVGAVLDFPSEADERIVAILGPGPAREVLASLLNGSQFNYVMLGSAADPNRLAQLILSVKPKDPAVGNGPARQAARPVMRPANSAVMQQQNLMQQKIRQPAQPPASNTLAAGGSQGGEGNALDAGSPGISEEAIAAVSLEQLQAQMEAAIAKVNAKQAGGGGTDANSPQIAQQAGAVASDTPRDDPGGRPPSTTRRRHRRR
jgi:hypothetical protein